LLYADRGGIHPGNILFVMVLYVGWISLYLYGFVQPLKQVDPLGSACPEDFVDLIGGSWTNVGWLILALATSLVDTQMAVTSTAEERSPINV